MARREHTDVDRSSEWNDDSECDDSEDSSSRQVLRDVFGVWTGPVWDQSSRDDGFGCEGDVCDGVVSREGQQLLHRGQGGRSLQHVVERFVVHRREQGWSVPGGDACDVDRCVSASSAFLLRRQQHSDK